LVAPRYENGLDENIIESLLASWDDFDEAKIRSTRLWQLFRESDFMKDVGPALVVESVENAVVQRE
jgi:hypothetical protein